MIFSEFFGPFEKILRKQTFYHVRLGPSVRDFRTSGSSFEQIHILAKRNQFLLRGRHGWFVRIIDVQKS
jgi:hypothetical protein